MHQYYFFLNIQLLGQNLITARKDDVENRNSPDMRKRVRSKYKRGNLYTTI